MTDIRSRIADVIAHHRLDSAEQVADVLLSLPGIAIVELPDTGNIWFDDGWARFEELSVPPKAEEMRRFAAALLAAANAAESVEVPSPAAGGQP